MDGIFRPIPAFAARFDTSTYYPYAFGSNQTPALHSGEIYTLWGANKKSAYPNPTNAIGDKIPCYSDIPLPRLENAVP